MTKTKKKVKKYTVVLLSMLLNTILSTFMLNLSFIQYQNSIVDTVTDTILGGWTKGVVPGPLYKTLLQ